MWIACAHEKARPAFYILTALVSVGATTATGSDLDSNLSHCFVLCHSSVADTAAATPAAPLSTAASRGSPLDVTG